MQCYATKNLVKEGFTLHRSSRKKCTKSVKDKFLRSVLFKLSYNSNLEGSTKNAKSSRFCNILKWDFLYCVILHVKCSVEKKTYSIQISLKNRALYFSGVFFTCLVLILIIPNDYAKRRPKLKNDNAKYIKTENHEFQKVLKKIVRVISLMTY